MFEDELMTSVPRATPSSCRLQAPRRPLRRAQQNGNIQKTAFFNLHFLCWVPWMPRATDEINLGVWVSAAEFCDTAVRTLSKAAMFTRTE